MTQKTVASLRMAERCVYKQYTRYYKQTDPSQTINYFACKLIKFIERSRLTALIESRRGGVRRRKEDHWFCICGNEWNTFDTGGVCPACLHQWAETQCHSCSRWSPHSHRYAQ